MASKPSDSATQHSDDCLPGSSASEMQLCTSFDWDSYLRETNSEAAPVQFFRQRVIYAKNEFRIGMKLRAYSPKERIRFKVIPVKVVDMIGPRLKLRPEENNKGDDDFWRLIDSEDILPLLNIPQAQHEAEMVAPPDIFSAPPMKPISNNFTTGMKFEAVFSRQPEFIGVATVGRVYDEHIEVTFDGYPKTFNYWCDYASRNIFPPEWCELNDHPLHCKGIRERMLNQSSVGELQDCVKTWS